MQPPSRALRRLLHGEPWCSRTRPEACEPRVDRARPSRRLPVSGDAPCAARGRPRAADCRCDVPRCRRGRVRALRRPVGGVRGRWVCRVTSTCGSATRSRGRPSPWSSRRCRSSFRISARACFRETLMAADWPPNVLLDTSSTNGWIRYTPGLTFGRCSPQTALGVRRGAPAPVWYDLSFFPRGWVKERLRAAVGDARRARRG